MNICVFGASSSTIDTSFIDETTLLGEKLAERGHSLIYGAGASGLMGAVARGVYSKGGSIVGVVPNSWTRIWAWTDVFLKTARSLF